MRAYRRKYLQIVALATMAAVPACGPELDMTRNVDRRGSIGDEVFGVLCDRVAAQDIREDLSGESFQKVCHADAQGNYADEVDLSKLPGTHPSTARIDALVRHRKRLVDSFNAVIPDTEVPVVKGTGPDACADAGTRKLGKEFADVLGRFGPLYKDGTMPRATEALSRVVAGFRGADDARGVWARLAGREGYRPRTLSAGMLKPMLQYPRLRDMASETLRLLSPDSDPFNPKPPRTPDGRRIPVPGAASVPFTHLLDAMRMEFKSATIDPPVKPLTVTPDARVTRELLSRPRTNLEFSRELFFSQDPAYNVQPSSFIVARDRRGFASVARPGGKLPVNFVDANGDSLPDVDAFGQFVAAGGAGIPTPFLTYDPLDPGVKVTRDASERALAGSALVYDYLDANHTLISKMVLDSSPLFDADATHNHETLMSMSAGLPLLFGGRKDAEKLYANNEGLKYSAYDIDTSPIMDLAYGVFQLMGDRSMDETLALTSSLMRDQTPKVARLVGAGLKWKATADAHPEAKNLHSGTSTFWDEMIDLFVKMDEEPGLLEDVLTALTDPALADMGRGMSNYMKFGDHISYDRKNLNGRTFNVTTNKAEDMKTPVDRSKPDTGWTRSGMSRFLQAVHDTRGVTSCNRQGAKAHAKLGPLNVTLPPVGSYKECEVFKIEDLASFYVRSIVGKAELYMRPSIFRNGIAGIGVATVDMIEQSSGIKGFWDPPDSKVFHPKPEYLNRLVNFDVLHDSVDSGPNHDTNVFISDLQGPHIGTGVCPERVITDPDSSAPDRSPDGLVHGLRDCQEGDWLDQRSPDATFVWEQFEFYKAFTPLVKAFVDHKKERLLVDILDTLFVHWQSEKGTAVECDPKNKASLRYCAQDGLVSYEPLLSEALVGDLLSAARTFLLAAKDVTVQRCTAVSSTGACTASTAVNGIQILADSKRSLFLPAKNPGLVDRKGQASTYRNDGTKIAQVTPLYLVLNALNAMDGAFADAEKKDAAAGDRHKKWLAARSQMVDHFLGVIGAADTSVFTNLSLPKSTPKLVALLRAQMYANCPTSFVPPYARCAWAKDQLPKKFEATLKGPTFAAAIDLLDAIRSDDRARQEFQLFNQYLVDAAGKNDALASTTAALIDLLQVIENDEDIVPLLHVVAEGLGGTKTDKDGHLLEAGIVDSNLSMLSRIALRAYDKDGHEACSKEIDPSQVINIALQNLVTRTSIDGEEKTPLDEFIDAIADINRADPKANGRLDTKDYEAITGQLKDFLSDEQSGLEQLYAIMRQGVE